MNSNNKNKPAVGRRERAGKKKSEGTTSGSAGRNGKLKVRAASKAELTFDVTPASKGTHKVTARIGDAVVGVNTFDIAKEKARKAFIDSIVKGKPSVDRDQAEQALLALAAKRQDTAEEQLVELDAQELLARMPQLVRDEALAMLKSPDLMSRVLDDVAACGVAGECELAAAIYLTAVSRLLKRPLSVIVQAQSSTGKSYLVEKVAELFPPEAVIHATAISPKALVYMEPGTLCHKFVVGGERTRRQDDETADATKMLREMQSSGRISQLVTVTIDGRMTTQRIEQDGPIAYIETTTVSNIFNEDANRSLLLATDERREQTNKIVEYQASRYSGDVTLDTGPIVHRHHALQRLLQQRPVVIPFASGAAERFKGERVEARRAYSHLMGMVEAIALLHQFQRQTDGKGRIVAERFDLELAECLCHGPLARLLDGQASAAAQRFLVWLSDWTDWTDRESRIPANESFTIAEAAKAFRVSKTAVQGWLNELKDSGLVFVDQPHRGSQPAKWSIVVQTQRSTGFLPTDKLPPTDNLPPSGPDLAQILCKTKAEIVVPSENQEREVGAESLDPATEDPEGEQLGNDNGDLWKDEIQF